MSQSRFLTILLVDDDPDDIQLVRSAFNFVYPTIQLHAAENGSDAFNYLDAVRPEHLPSMVILDYNMPRMNGLEVLKLIKNKERYRVIPKVIMTTAGHEQLKKLCPEDGADKFLVKPHSYAKLLDIVKDLIRWCREGI